MKGNKSIKDFKILSILINLLFPKQCLICGKIGKYICNDCEEKIKKYEIDKYEINKQNNNKKLFIYKYEDEIRKLIIDYKFNDKAYLYKLFLNEIIKNKNICNFIKSYDIIIPVPVHWKRKLERGYNQTELIIKEISKLLKVDFSKNTLIKEKNIKPLSKMGAKDRKKNIKGVFSIKNNQRIFNKKVLLFDDIYTTGSTFKECEKILKEAGAKEVGMLSLARDTYTNKQKKGK